MNRVTERIVNADTSFAQNIFFHCDTPRFKFGKPRQSSGERKDGKKKKNFRAAKSLCACGAVSPRSGGKHRSGYAVAAHKKMKAGNIPQCCPPVIFYFIYLPHLLLEKLIVCKPI